MQYPTFHAMHIGAAHVRRALPCQDMCMSVQDERYSIAVVSDGHGNRRHFRSERGAKKACEIAVDSILNFLNRTEQLTDAEREAQIQNLKLEICRRWRTEILTDAANHPWTPEEIEEQQQILTNEQFALFQTGQTAAYAYGCTLCAVFTADWGWGAIQVGDGCLTVIESDGTYRWPMPPSTINSGHRTASLCSDHPMSDFRHIMENRHPICLMVYSDGIEKSFPSQGREIISLLHWVWKNQRFGEENRLQMLTRMLAQLTESNPQSDDVSIAGLIDPNAEDVEPRFDRPLLLQELRTLEAQRDELMTAVQYNRQRLKEIQHDEEQISARHQILRILNRREADVKTITQEINEKRTQLGLPPLQNPENNQNPPLETTDSAKSPPTTESNPPENDRTPDHRGKEPYSGQKNNLTERPPLPKPCRDQIPDPLQSLFPGLTRLMEESRKEMNHILNILKKNQ